MEDISDSPDFCHGNKCIWMEADVVAYKLCDQNYDCERCTFDFVMRNTWKEKTDSENVVLNFANNSLIDNIIGKISRIFYDRKLIYLKNQLVLKHMFGSVYTIGISQLLSNLIENIDEVEMLNDYGLVKKEEKLLSIRGKWGSKEILSPMDFTLLQKLDIDPDEFPDDNVFGVVSVGEPEITLARVSVERVKKDNYRLLKKLRNFLETEPQIGYTMMDGGNRCEYLYEALGLDTFQKIISNLN